MLMLKLFSPLEAIMYLLVLPITSVLCYKLSRLDVIHFRVSLRFVASLVDDCIHIFCPNSFIIFHQYHLYNLNLQNKPNSSSNRKAVV